MESIYDDLAHVQISEKLKKLKHIKELQASMSILSVKIHVSTISRRLNKYSFLERIARRKPLLFKRAETWFWKLRFAKLYLNIQDHKAFWFAQGCTCLILRPTQSVGFNIVAWPRAKS